MVSRVEDGMGLSAVVHATTVPEDSGAPPSMGSRP
jgi:hypothetical protein